MDNRLLQGVFPPIPTPFDASGAVDHEALKRNLKWWNRHELSGYVALGSNGESVHLTEPEKLRVIADVRAKAPDDHLIIAGTGLLSTQATIALTEQAAEVGADAALVLPPFYYRGQMTSDVLVEHFRAIADASSIPIVLYNMPGNTGIDMAAHLVIELSRHENIVGIKDSAGNIVKLSEIRHSADTGFSVLAGSAGFFLPALAVGADGGVLGLANIAPSICIEIFSAARRGAWDEARALQNKVVRANSAVTRQWGVPALKAAMDLLGLAGGPPRPPLLPLSDERRSELSDILTDAGIL
ncbi:MAG: dihydrodipicolinate synthase family protein [Candidatus Bipolaricaulia bacterium]